MKADRALTFDGGRRYSTWHEQKKVYWVAGASIRRVLNLAAVRDRVWSTSGADRSAVNRAVVTTPANGCKMDNPGWDSVRGGRGKYWQRCDRLGLAKPNSAAPAKSWVTRSDLEWHRGWLRFGIQPIAEIVEIPGHCFAKHFSSPHLRSRLRAKQKLHHGFPC